MSDSSGQPPVEVRPDGPLKVAIVGEIPFSGRALAKALLSVGTVPRVLCPDARAEEATGAGAEIVHGDLSSAQALSDTLQGVGVVCFLSPITMSGRMYRPDTHLDDVRNVIKLAETHAVAKLIYHSSLSAHPSANAEVLREAARAEELIAQARCEAIRIRTSPLMGVGDGFLTEIAAIARTSGPVIKIPGYGSTPVQPLHVNDLARCITRLCVDASVPKYEVYTLAGPQSVTLLELLDSFLKLTGKARLKFHVPLFALKLAAALKRDARFSERVGLLFDSFNTDENDAPDLLGAQLINFRQTQQELLV